MTVKYDANGNESDRHYYYADGQGSIIATLNSMGNVIDKFSYSPFGINSASNDHSDQPWGYTGRRYDQESGLYYYRARYYNPSLGRFISADPIGYDDQMNMYAYVANSPMNFTDPSGMARSDLGNDGATVPAGDAPDYPSSARESVVKVAQTLSIEVISMIADHYGVPTGTPIGPVLNIALHIGIQASSGRFNSTETFSMFVGGAAGTAVTLAVGATSAPAIAALAAGLVVGGVSAYVVGQVYPALVPQRIENSILSGG